MAISNTTTHSNAIKTIYAPTFIQGVYFNSFLKYFGTPKPRGTVGDNKYTWPIHSSVNTGVEVFDESTSYPTATYQGVVKAQVSPVYSRVPVELTGILLDAIGASGNYSPMDVELNEGINQLRDLFATSFIGSTYGLELAVDYGSSYAGITRNGSAAYFESTETAVGGAIELSDYTDLLETIRDNDKGGDPNRIFMPWNQVGNFAALTPNSYNAFGAPGDKSIELTGNSTGTTNLFLSGIPIIGVGDMTDTVALMVDMNEKAWEEWRPFSVKKLGDTDDNTKYQISAGLMFALLNPRKSGKLTGITA